MAESNQDGSQISINFEDGNLASDGENFPMDWNIFDLSQEEISGGDSISFNLEGLDVEREETWNFKDLRFDQRSITSSMSWNVNDVGNDDNHNDDNDNYSNRSSSNSRRIEYAVVAAAVVSRMYPD